MKETYICLNCGHISKLHLNFTCKADDCYCHKFILDQKAYDETVFINRVEKPE